MIPSETVALRPELVAYEAVLARVLPQHAGEYVVIKGDQLLEYFGSYDLALDWAYDKFGLESFFVKRVVKAELNTVHFTRALGPCRS